MTINNIAGYLLLTIGLSFIFSSPPSIASESSEDYFSLSIEELASIKVVTSSRREQSIDESYANIMVVTKEIIQRRGYKNVIEVLEDLPGFDFATYEDGGGEYTVHFLNRGVGGDNGNTRLLVMIDGLVQNHISFNWAQGLTDEQMLIDVERIEVVQGPGSSLYGAQAVSGIVHIITKDNFQGTDLKVLVGENNTQTFEFLHGGSIGTVNYQVALKSHQSDGDMGKDRPDPAGYFTGNVYPDILLANYDSNGNYQTNVPHPLAGVAIPDGFNNSKDDRTFRFKIGKDDLQLGINFWDRKDGLGSYVVGYEYDATANDFISHHSGLTVYMKNGADLLEDELRWKSDLWYRLDKQQADTGFRYNYRFNDLKKSYHSASSQIGFENQFEWQLQNGEIFIFGLRLLGLRQTDQVISLGQEQNGSQSTTDSSWDIAVAGDGLNQEKVNEIFDETETAAYALLEGKISDNLSYSVGTRFSNGSDYGSANNPRAGLIYHFDNDWLIKALYGSAFRQPSLFELNDEFRGSDDLTPEKIETYEVQASKAFENLGRIQFNIFHSNLTDSINLIEDLSRAGGERYANVDSSKVRGFSTLADLQPWDNVNIYFNYIYQQGTNEQGNWGKLSHTAQNKANLGINWHPQKSHYNIDLRLNYVGNRTTPSSNSYFNGKAPGYTKLDLAFSWTDLLGYQGLSSQLIVSNLLDESYFGVGRQAGSSNRDDYDPLLNPNPLGFIPAYHPQPGRHISVAFSYRIQ